jgi:HPt (histidine-containing phosphotransfer) domain-containing protein
MCMGVAKLRDQLLDTFLSEIGPRLERLAEAVSLGDAHQVEVEAHGLRGMLGTIGARAGAELFSALETLSIGGDITAAGPLLKRATLEASRARAAIEALPFRNAA